MHVSGRQFQPISRLAAPPVLAIGKGFKGFGARDGLREEPIHTALEPDSLTKLRTLRETLKTADPEQVWCMMEITHRMSFFEAIALATQQKRLLVSNFAYDRVLTRTDANSLVKTGTIIIYEAPNQPFGEVVVFGGIHFTIPIQFRGLVNHALAVEYPDFDLKNGELVVPDEKTIHLIREFPTTDGWYLTHAETGIPCGGEVNQTNESARCLSRSSGSRISSVDRTFFYGVNKRHISVFGMSWLCDSGVALI